jgi:hypothetical protein
MGQWPGRMGRRWWLVESWWRGWRLDKPPELWWWRFMGQSVVSETSIRSCAPTDGRAGRDALPRVRRCTCVST